MNDFGFAGMGCFSSFRRANYGRLHLEFEQGATSITIEDKWGKRIYAQCKIETQ